MIHIEPPEEKERIRHNIIYVLAKEEDRIKTFSYSVTRGTYSLFKELEFEGVIQIIEKNSNCHTMTVKLLPAADAEVFAVLL